VQAQGLRTPLFGLAPGGVYRAANCYQSRGALLPHLFTLTSRGWRSVFCGTFHRLAPSRRYLAPCPKEPGLSSIANYSDCLADSGFLGRESTAFACDRDQKIAKLPVNWAVPSIERVSADLDLRPGSSSSSLRGRSNPRVGAIEFAPPWSAPALRAHRRSRPR